jgi:hypothetical protein
VVDAENEKKKKEVTEEEDDEHIVAQIKQTNFFVAVSNATPTLKMAMDAIEKEGQEIALMNNPVMGLLNKLPGGAPLDVIKRITTALTVVDREELHKMILAHPKTTDLYLKFFFVKKKLR